MNRQAALCCLGLLVAQFATAQTLSADAEPGIAPDIRRDDTSLKFQRGNYVVVPIPIANPTLGLRFMVLAEKRINLRLDYARSTDSDAIHFSVGEAF